VLPITAISTHGPNLPSEVARSTSNSSHKHLRTTNQVDIHRVESTSMSTRFRSTWICRCVTNHTHTPTHHTCVHSISLHHLCVHSISLHLVSSMCFHTHSTKWKYLERTHRVCPLDVSTHGRVDRFPHTPHTPTNHGNQVNIKRVDHTWCRRGVAAHTPHTPMHHRNHEERARINHNYVSTRILSSWFCLFVPKTHTHIPHPTPPTCANPGAGRNTAIPGKRRFGRCPEQLHFGQRCFRLCPK